MGHKSSKEENFPSLLWVSLQLLKQKYIQMMYYRIVYLKHIIVLANVTQISFFKNRKKSTTKQEQKNSIQFIDYTLN